MSKSTKNNLVFILLLVGAAAIGIYVLVKPSPPQEESFDSSPIAGINDPIPARNTEPSEPRSTPEGVPSDTTPQVPLPSINDLDEGMQKVIAKVDAGLNLAFNLQLNDPKREKLLKDVVALIDSALTNEKNAFLLASLGTAYLLQGKNLKSIEAYDKSLEDLAPIEEIVKNRASAAYNASIQFIRKNDSDNAIMYLNQFYDVIPYDKNAKALLLKWEKERGVGKMRAGDFKGGKQLFQQALAKDSTDHSALFNLGISYYKLLDFDMAIKTFESCIAMKNNDDFSRNYLYTIYRQKGDLETAKKYETEPIKVRKNLEP